jgi:Putative phage holin Dp-1
LREGEKVEETQKRDHIFSNKLYGVLNACALIVFPAVGTLYFALASIWGLPAAEQVTGSIIVVDTFLGVLVKVGQNSYDASDAKYDGDMIVAKTDDKTSVSLALNTDPEKMLKQDQVIFKVKPTA